MKPLLILLCLLLPASMMAQDIISPDEFEEYAEGYTLYFSENGQHYGSEQFLANRRTVWRAGDGTCVNGKWVDSEGDMCFIYDNDTGVHCWTTYRAEGRIFVQSTTGPADANPTLLELSEKDTVPIICTGPIIGV